MDGEVSNVVAVEKTVTPTLIFGVQLKSYDESMAVLGVSGHLLSACDRLLCPLFELDQSSRSTSATLHGPTGPSRDGGYRSTDYANVGGQLGPKEIDHIEDARTRDPKGDVYFRLRLTIRRLVATAGTFEVQDPRELMMSGRNAPARGSGRPLSLLHELQGAGFLVQNVSVSDIRCRIGGTDWLKDYAPQLGLGNFAVLDIPDPSDLPTVTDERFTRAVKHALKARDILRAGEWEDVCEELRHVWETLRDLPLVQDALVADGYTSEAADLMNHALKDLFNLASKFVHSLDRDKKVLPEIKPKKEDAYLVFTTTMSAMSLIARKAQRSDRRS